MIVDKNTTLKELHELKRHCMKRKEKAIDARFWMCYECEYHAYDIGCNCIDINGKVPYEWVLPRVDIVQVKADKELKKLYDEVIENNEEGK